MRANGSIGKSGYAGPAHDGARRLIQKALTKHEEDRLRRFIDARGANVTLALFQCSEEPILDHFHTATYEAVKYEAVKPAFARRLDELLDQIMYRLAESQDIKQHLVRTLTSLLAFTLLVDRTVNRQAKRAVARKEKFR